MMVIVPSKPDGRVGQRMPYSLQVRFTERQRRYLLFIAESFEISTGAAVRHLLDQAIEDHLASPEAGDLRALLDVADIVEADESTMGQQSGAPDAR